MLVGHVAGCAAFCILGGGVGGGGGGGVVPLVGISRPPMTDAWQGPPASWGGHAYMHTWPAAWWTTSTDLIFGGKCQSMWLTAVVWLFSEDFLLELIYWKLFEL